MSLQQAAALFDYQQRQRSPLERGLQAGQTAYTGYNDTRAQYQNTGASKSAYDYLEGRGAYPVNQSTDGSISRPYEQATGISGPTSQQEISKAAAAAPWRGGTSSTGSSGQGVQMPKQSGLSQLIGVAGPAYLGYKFLVPNAAKDWLAETTGFESLGASSGAGAGAGSAGAAGSAAANASPYAATSTMAIEPLRGPIETAQFEGYPGGDYTMTGANAEATSAPSFLTPEQQSYYYADGTAIPASDAAVTTITPTATTAPVTGGTAISETALPDMVAEQTAAIDASNAAAAAETASAAEGATAAEAATAAGGEEAAAAMTTEEMAAMAAEYGPYIAAALIADQLLTGGSVRKGIGDLLGGITDTAGDIVSGLGNVVSDIGSGIGNVVSDVGSGIGNVVQGAGDVVGDVVGGVGDVVGGAVDTASNFVNDIFDWADGGSVSSQGRNFAEGGETVGGLGAAAVHYNLGGYSDGGRLLKGPGDGVSDSIPASIGKNRQPARLADGEFVVPARIVSELGNGSTEAGARKLYAMMDRVQADRKKSIGKGKVAVNSRADKHLPK